MTDPESIWCDVAMGFLKETPGFHDKMTLKDAAEARGMTPEQAQAHLECRVAEIRGQSC